MDAKATGQEPALWHLPGLEPFVGAHYCLWYKNDWTNASFHGSRTGYTPVRGSYQSSDPKIIQAHVDEILGCGINTIMCSWMPPETGHRLQRTPFPAPPWLAVEPNYEDRNLDLLLEAAGASGLKVVVLLEANRLRDEFMEDTEYALVRPDTTTVGGGAEAMPAFTRDATAEQYAKNMVYLLRKHGDHPGWLRLVNPSGEAKPAIFLFPTAAWGASYDEESLGKWRSFLKARYDDSVEKLNDSWGTSRKTFDDIAPFDTPVEQSKGHNVDSTMWLSGETEKALRKIKELVKAEIGISPFIIGLQPPETTKDMHATGVHPRYLRNEPDGYVDYNSLGIGLDQETIVHHQQLYGVGRALSVKWAKENRQFCGLMACAGFDDRYIIPNARKLREYIPRSEERLHRSFLEAMKLDPDGLFLCSYNEWWENTGVEQTEEFGDTYLRIVKRYADAFKGMKRNQLY